MGIRLIILLALLLGVLYCLHLLVKDYQALMAAPRLLRFLFKRDVNPLDKAKNIMKPNVRWKMILLHDPIQCAQYLYCTLGVGTRHTEVQRGFVYMLTIEPREVDAAAHKVFLQAHNHGRRFKDERQCKNEYPYCPFDSELLFQLIQYLLSHHS